MNLAKLMFDRNMRDIDLANQLDVARSTVLQWRVGTYQPRADLIPKICVALSCTPEDLLGFDLHRPTTLPRAKAEELLQAVTRGGDFNSDALHSMASAVRRARNGQITEMECWLREMAEVLYRIECAPKPIRRKRNAVPITSVQLKLFTA